MKKSLEAQHRELEEKRHQLEEERAGWETQHRILELQKLDASRWGQYTQYTLTTSDTHSTHWTDGGILRERRRWMNLWTIDILKYRPSQVGYIDDRHINGFIDYLHWYVHTWMIHR